MPATKLRTPEIEEFPSASLALDSQPDTYGPDTQTQWNDYASYVDVFVATPADEEKGRDVSPHNRHFRLNTSFLAGTLVFAQLLALCYFYSLDLKYTRAASKLDEQIRQTRLEISLTQSKMAASKSASHLAQWSAQLGYRPAQISDMDDTTSNAPFVPAPKKAEAAR